MEQVFTQANHRLCEGNEADMFVTAWMGVLDLSTGRVRYANAGHNPPLLRRKDGELSMLCVCLNSLPEGAGSQT